MSQVRLDRYMPSRKRGFQAISAKDRSVNQSTSQSTSQSVKQSIINQSVVESSNSLDSQSINQSVEEVPPAKRQKGIDQYFNPLRSIDESINQSINQSNDQPINQSINQPTDLAADAGATLSLDLMVESQAEMTNQSIDQLITQPSVNQSVNQSVDTPMRQSIHQSTNQLINQSIEADLTNDQVEPQTPTQSATINQSSETPPRASSINQSISQSIIPNETINQSSNQSTNQSVNRSTIDWEVKAPTVQQPPRRRMTHFRNRFVSPSTNQPVTQSVNQSVNPGSNNRPVDPTIDQSTNHTINPISQTTLTLASLQPRQPVRRPITQLSSLSSSVSQSINQSTSQTTNQSAEQSVNQSTDQPVNQAINQPINQPLSLADLQPRTTPLPTLPSLSTRRSLMSSFSGMPSTQSTNPAFQVPRPRPAPIVTSQSINQSINRSKYHSLILPAPYLFLLHVFHGLECAMTVRRARSMSQSINQAGNQPSNLWSTLKPSVELIVGRSINQSHLGQIAYLFPESYSFQSINHKDAWGRQSIDYLVNRKIHDTSSAQSINQSINQSIQQDEKQSISQLVSQVDASKKQPISLSSLSLRPSINQSTSRSISPLIRSVPSINQPVSQPVNQPTSQSVDIPSISTLQSRERKAEFESRLINFAVTQHEKLIDSLNKSVNQSINQSSDQSSSIGQSVDQSINQSGNRSIEWDILKQGFHPDFLANLPVVPSVALFDQSINQPINQSSSQIMLNLVANKVPLANQSIKPSTNQSIDQSLLAEPSTPTRDSNQSIYQSIEPGTPSTPFTDRATFLAEHRKRVAQQKLTGTSINQPTNLQLARLNNLAKCEKLIDCVYFALRTSQKSFIEQNELLALCARNPEFTQSADLIAQFSLLTSLCPRAFLMRKTGIPPQKTLIGLSKNMNVDDVKRTLQQAKSLEEAEMMREREAERARWQQQAGETPAVEPTAKRALLYQFKDQSTD